MNKTDAGPSCGVMRNRDYALLIAAWPLVLICLIGLAIAGPPDPGHDADHRG